MRLILPRETLGNVERANSWTNFGTYEERIGPLKTASEGDQLASSGPRSSPKSGQVHEDRELHIGRILRNHVFNPGSTLLSMCHLSIVCAIDQFVEDVTFSLFSDAGRVLFGTELF